MQQRAGQRAAVVLPASRGQFAAADAGFAPGERVFHPKFGYGLVLGVEGDKLTVDFDKAGEKRLLASFVLAADAADDVPF
jgi:DNA helicase-2/ATP-dependent DNA helicase PcrA